jgi:outer membrane lipoprotein-sorting protein
MRPRLLGLFFLIPFCLSLASCARRETLTATDDIADYYAKLESASTQATVTADFGDRVIDFTLRYDYLRDGVSTVEILSPEEVRGIKATIEAGRTELTYDGLILETGPLPGTGLTPADALHAMLRVWGSGYAASTGPETLDGVSCIHVTYKSTVSGVDIQQDAWFDSDTFKPLRAETLAGGRRVITCVFDTFNFG